VRIDPAILKAVGAHRPPPPGKLFTKKKQSDKIETECQWRGCSRVGVRKVGKTNIPTRKGNQEEWWFLCGEHTDQALVMRRELLVTRVDPQRRTRLVSQATFK
jgi:hypothetical protein